MERFRVEVISKTLNPNQTVYAALHQDYNEGFVFDDRSNWPDEKTCGEIAIKRLLAGDRGHFGPFEHPSIVFNCGYFPHSTMQQVRTHRVGCCLSGDTLVRFGHKSLHSGEKYQQQTLGHLADLWHNGRKHQQTEADAAYMREQISKRSVLSLDLKTNMLVRSRITNIYCNGPKELYLLTTADGQSIKATMCHQFWTNQGWKRLKEFNSDTKVCVPSPAGQPVSPTLVNYNNQELCSEVWKVVPDYPWYEISNLGRLRSYMPRGGRGNRSKEKRQTPIAKKLSQAKNYLFASFSEGVGTGKSARLNIHRLVCEVFNPLPDRAIGLDNLEVRHLNSNSFDNRANNFLAWGTSRDNSLDLLEANAETRNRGVFVDVDEIIYAGIEETYDLEVSHPDHNFVGNGIIVHNSFDVQSNRYTGKRIAEAAAGLRDIEDIFYLRPVGYYSDRQGKRYHYTREMRDRDLAWCVEAAQRYQQLLAEGLAEEHARGIIPFDVRQHWVMSVNPRSLMHLLDLRAKPDAQLEIQKLCELIWPHFQAWMPELAAWYENKRLRKARLSP